MSSGFLGGLALGVAIVGAGLAAVWFLIAYQPAQRTRRSAARAKQRARQAEHQAELMAQRYADEYRKLEERSERLDRWSDEEEDRLRSLATAPGGADDISALREDCERLRLQVENLRAQVQGLEDELDTTRSRYIEVLRLLRWRRADPGAVEGIG